MVAKQVSVARLFLGLLCCCTAVIEAWVVPPKTQQQQQQAPGNCDLSKDDEQRRFLSLTLFHAVSKGDDEPEEDDSSLFESLKKAPEIDNEESKLGIDIGAMLEPLSDKEAAELKAAATEIINDAVAEGIDEIEKLRVKMKKEVEKKRKSAELASEMAAKREAARLLNKIDELTDGFLSSTEVSRSSTKLAAAADKAMQGSGRGIELGTWGELGGATVVAGQSSLLGSVAAAEQKLSAGSSTEEKEATASNRIVVVADADQDPFARKLLPGLTEELQKALPGLEVDVYKPTATLPLGGDNAACAILFCTSLTDKSTVSLALDRLLRKTLQPGSTPGKPPTQLVAISTIGTERTNKMPYSMQNMMGGKLDNRRQMEETIIRTVRDRASMPSLDYTICKLGELKDGEKGPFQFGAGDTFGGSTSVDAAVTVLSQAIAFQPSARNATLSVVGSLPSGASEEELEDILEDAFLRLEGPELVRIDLEADPETNYLQLVEYLREWAFLLADTGKGLTTPVRAESMQTEALVVPGVKKRGGVRLLFLPTSTGKNYLSREEEVKREKKGMSTATAPRKVDAKEGGVEILVEVTDEEQLRVRAKRCNYADDVVIKELSEEAILSRFQKCIDVWKNEHQIS